MSQAGFEARHRADWQALARDLDALESRRPGRAVELDRLPGRYAALCRQHALTTERGYGDRLAEELHDLIVRAHRQLYRHRVDWVRRLVRFAGGDFARAVRAELPLFLFASLLFVLPLLVTGTLCALNPDWTDLVIGSDARHRMESMYDPEARAVRPPGMESSGRFMMFGHYVYNNVGIDFRVFAGGLLFGLGAVFFLVFNGVHIGAVGGHLTGIGYDETFYGFVAGHGAPELVALCISGTAGLMLGRALLRPGRKTRAHALRHEARRAVPLILGAALLTFIAAFIEAWWSPLELPYALKLAVGALVWTATLAYLAFAGRRSGGPA